MKSNLLRQRRDRLSISERGRLWLDPRGGRLIIQRPPKKPKVVWLTNIQTLVAHALISSDSPLSATELLERAWNNKPTTKAADRNLVSVTLSNLRNKVGADVLPRVASGQSFAGAPKVWTMR